MDYDFRQILLPPFVAFAAPVAGQTYKLSGDKDFGQAIVRTADCGLHGISDC
jgi:hypothetical protein